MVPPGTVGGVAVGGDEAGLVGTKVLVGVTVGVAGMGVGVAVTVSVGVAGTNVAVAVAVLVGSAADVVVGVFTGVGVSTGPCLPVVGVGVGVGSGVLLKSFTLFTSGKNIGSITSSTNSCIFVVTLPSLHSIVTT